MAASKTSISVFSGQTTTSTSAAKDVSAVYAATLFVDIVVVGTPTAAASFQVQESPDGGTTYYLGPVISTNLAAATYDFKYALDPTTDHVKVTFTQQTGGTSSTCTAQIGTVTGI